MNFTTIYQQYKGQLEDQWGKRASGPVYGRTIYPFGRAVRLTSNEEGVLRAADFCQPLYSTAAESGRRPFEIHLVVRPMAQAPGPPPEFMFDQIQYTGYDHWLMLHLGGWGHCYVDLAAGQAVAVLAPELAARPAVVSHNLLNTVITNLFFGDGYGMLHATGLVRRGLEIGDWRVESERERVLLLMAPHNSGKSTTALRLALAGYALLSDSQVWVLPDEKTLTLGGFPVGKAKLRRDMMEHFPQLQPFLRTERVRDEMKFTVDLRRYDPARVQTAAARPAALALCLIQTNGSRETHLTPAGEEEVTAAVMANSFLYDTAANWEANLRQIMRVVERARCYRLEIGTEAAGIVAAVEGVWENVG